MEQTYKAEARADLGELLLGVRALQTNDHFVKRARVFGIRHAQRVAVNVLPQWKDSKGNLINLIWECHARLAPSSQRRQAVAQELEF